MPDLNEIKHAPATLGILDAIDSRRSPRAFRDTAVSTEDLRKIFSAAPWAASSTNEQA